MESVLTEDDIKYLDTTFPNSWEIKNKIYLIIRNYYLPRGYNIDKVEMMILIPNQYPMAKLDMFYVHPSIERLDNKNIEALALENHLEQNWQRWSRHYEWRPGIHNLSTHLAVVKNSLEEELVR